MSTSDPVVIVSAVRTPLGRFQGELSSFSGHNLGSHAIGAALERAKLSPEQIDEVLMGCVLPAGQGQAPARQAARGAKLPDATGATTINKVCGSGMKATMLAHDLINAGSANIVVSGGMESMTNAPYLLQKARGGYRVGHDRIIDHMMMDGLEDAYEKGRLMGTFAEDCAGLYNFTREQQDAYAIASLTRAQAAIKDGSFEWEITPVTVAGRKGDVTIASDEQPPKANLDKIPTLKPAFRKDGTVTPANSSSISDGAAALVLMRASTAAAKGLTPIAKIVGHTTHAHQPNLFATAPVGAMQKLLAKTGWTTTDVDLWEINEAFAVVTMAAIHDLQLDPAKVNIHGGACALGHPIGASGARIIVTLLGALKKTGGKRGIASLCIGGGEATALAVEML